MSDDHPRVTVSPPTDAVEVADVEREERHVVEFVRGRNVYCPTCSYNLRDSVSARCTECGTTLQLTLYGVGGGRPWGYPTALTGLVLGALASALAGMGGLGSARPGVALVGGALLVSCVVGTIVVESRFWKLWAKYARHRTVGVIACWAPLVLAVMAIGLLALA